MTQRQQAEQPDPVDDKGHAAPEQDAFEQFRPLQGVGRRDVARTGPQDDGR